MTEQPYPSSPTGPAPGRPPQQPLGGPGQPFPDGRGPAPMTPSAETTWATVSHLSWLAGSLVALPFLGPLVLFLVLKDRGPYVRHHTVEALNFQLSLLLYGLGLSVVGGLLSLVTLGLLLPVWGLAGGALVLAGVVFTIIAAVAASRGEWYRYPLTIRFVR